MFIIHDALIIVHRKKIKIKLVHVYFYTLQKSQFFNERDAREILQQHLKLLIVQDAHIF